MNAYLLSLAAGVLIGIVYSLLRIRSPAPPLIALIGLLGMLIGEQAIPCAKQWPGYSALPAASREANTASGFSGDRPCSAPLHADCRLAGNKEAHS